MATASVEVSGPNAEHLAGELQAALVAAIRPGDNVSPVEVESRSRSCWMMALGSICQAWTRNSWGSLSLGERRRGIDGKR